MRGYTTGYIGDLVVSEEIWKNRKKILRFLQ